MAVTAVTGDIGAGKSTVSWILARLMHCDVIDADVVAKSMWLRDDVKDAVLPHWGRGILDASGKISVPEVSRRIFADKNEHDYCNSVIHPLVMRELRERTRLLDATVVEIPLLPEVGRPSWVDRVVYVTAGFEARAERCRASRGWNDEELKRREKFLLPQNLRMSVSDYVIRNEGSLSELERQAVIFFFLQENDK